MKRNLISLCLVLFWLGVTDVWATWQQPDILIYEGKQYPIYNEPLDAYFRKNPERRPEICERNSSLWRGYIAEIEVVKNQMFLKDVRIKMPGYSVSPACQNESVLSRVVPSGERLKIDWISGLLDSFYGKNDGNPYSLEFLDSFEKYSIFEIVAGNIKQVRHFDNKQYHDFRKRQFEAFKKTSEYRETVKKMTADGRLKISDADANIMLWLVSYTKKFLVD